MSERKLMLERLTLSGFKTIKSLELELGPMNVLIGANGAGKSNLLMFFRMLSQMLTSPGHLQFFVGKEGGASTLLHSGTGVTREVSARLKFSDSTKPRLFTTAAASPFQRDLKAAHGATPASRMVSSTSPLPPA